MDDLVDRYVGWTTLKHTKISKNSSWTCNLYGPHDKFGVEVLIIVKAYPNQIGIVLNEPCNKWKSCVLDIFQPHKI
jgi:hypothetical protein